jgi:hypothetical protein
MPVATPLLEILESYDYRLVSSMLYQGCLLDAIALSVKLTDLMT